MSRRARARAGAINAKRIAFNRDPEQFEDDEGAAPDVHDEDHEAWAWAADKPASEPQDSLA